VSIEQVVCRREAEVTVTGFQQREILQVSIAVREQEVEQYKPVEFYHLDAPRRNILPDQLCDLLVARLIFQIGTRSVGGNPRQRCKILLTQVAAIG
jgi:hypothetical protein